MERNWTRGPWRVRQHGDANHHFILQENGHWLMVLKQNGEKSSVELDANAAIVAAAPELLEALEATLEWIDAVPEDLMLPAMPGVDRDWVNSVIAKAKREEAA